MRAFPDSGKKSFVQYLLRRYDMKRNIEDVPFV